MLGDLVEGRREACLTSARSIAGRHLLRPPHGAKRPRNLGRVAGAVL